MDGSGNWNYSPNINFTLLVCVCECMRMRLPLFPPSVIKFVVSCKLARVGRLLLLLLDPWPPATKMCTIHVYARIFQNYKNHARNYRQSKKPGEWVRSSCGNSLPAIVRVLCLENQFLFPNVVWNSIWNWLIENLHPLISRPAVKLVLLLAQVSVCRGKICEIKWKYILAS